MVIKYNEENAKRELLKQEILELTVVARNKKKMKLIRVSGIIIAIAIALTVVATLTLNLTERITDLTAVMITIFTSIPGTVLIGFGFNVLYFKIESKNIDLLKLSPNAQYYTVITNNKLKRSKLEGAFLDLDFKNGKGETHFECLNLTDFTTTKSKDIEETEIDLDKKTICKKTKKG